MANSEVRSRDVTRQQIRDLLGRYDIEPAPAMDILASGIDGVERTRLRKRISQERTRMRRAGEIGTGAPEAAPQADPLGDLPDFAAMGRQELLVWQLGLLGRALQEAKPGSTAYGQAARALKSTHAELIEAREAEQRAGDVDPADLSPEEWRLRVLEDAREADDEDLELYVSEWLKRKGYELAVSDRGRLRLRKPDAHLEVG